MFCLNKYFSKIITSICIFVFTGCSSLKENKTLQAGLASFAACSLVGAVTAPDGEKEIAHASLWGGGCSALSMGAVELWKDRKSRKITPHIQVGSLDKSYSEEQIRESIMSSSSFKSLDEESKKKIKGKWNLYKTDSWSFDGKKMIHEDLEIRFKE